MKLSRIMTPRRKTVFAVVGLIFLVMLVVFRVVGGSKDRRQRTVPVAETAPATKKPMIEESILTKSGTRFIEMVLPENATVDNAEEKPIISKKIRDQMITQPQPMGLFSVMPEKPKPVTVAPPIYYLPPKRLIPCKLISNAETGAPNIPLIGIIAEDQYNIDEHGVSRLVLPAGVEVHGFATTQPRRNRIDASGPWQLVWRTRDQNNATTYTVNAIALQRDYDPATGLYGSKEKSPGLVGERIETPDERLIKLVALNMASAITTSLRETTTTLNPLANSTVVTPDNSVANALLTGGSAGMDAVAEYVKKIRDTIIQEGFYVIVYADTQFYLYTQEAIDLRTSARPPETPIAAVPVSENQPKSSNL